MILLMITITVMLVQNVLLKHRFRERPCVGHNLKFSYRRQAMSWTLQQAVLPPDKFTRLSYWYF